MEQYVKYRSLFCALVVFLTLRYNSIDGQVCSVRLQTDNFRLRDKQTVNGVRKIPRAFVSIYRLKWQHIYIQDIYIGGHRQLELIVKTLTQN
jgi:hypothetical protein